ncbi:streptothricin acetyltransferase [Bacillus sp. AR18-7]|nr:streptothricin acetyltransferase [Bacillus sp. AR18-7]
MLIYVKQKIVIGGFDFLVYKGLDMTSDEFVIYWYLYFDS